MSDNCGICGKPRSECFGENTSPNERIAKLERRVDTLSALIDTRFDALQRRVEELTHNDQPEAR